MSRGGTDPITSVATAVAGLPPGALSFVGGVLALLPITLLRIRSSSRTASYATADR